MVRLERVSLQRQCLCVRAGLRREARHFDFDDRFDGRIRRVALQARQDDVAAQAVRGAAAPGRCGTPGSPRNSQWNAHSFASMLRAVPP